MKTLSLILIIFSTNFTFGQNHNGTYLGMQATEIPVLLAPDILASSLQEYNGTFSPDGKEFYFTTNTPLNGIICYTKMNEDASWSPVKVASFSGEYSEYDPLFSPDGKRLYFSSERPIQDSLFQGTNIWYVEKTVKGWSKAKLVPLSGDGDYYSSIASNGNIYFNVWNNGDIFKAEPNDTSFTITKLPSAINTDNGEGDPFIAPDESYMIFRGYNNSLGNGDLYISYQINGAWTEAENLGAPINSSAHEICPLVSPDGKYLIFSSRRINSEYQSPPESSIAKIRDQHQSFNNGEQNIYYISAAFIDKLKEKHIKN